MQIKSEEKKLSMIVINNVKYFRTKAGLSEQELSRMIGKKDDFIKRLENHKLKKEPTFVLLNNLSDVLDVDIKEFFIERK